MKKIISLVMSLFIILNISSINIYGDNKKQINEIHITSVEDWNKLSKDCSLDTYSNNIKVILDNDITFAEEEFKSIGYFNGEFDGQNHKLSGIQIDAKTINYGVIRLSCANANIHDLNISYSLKTSENRAGFVGYNQGTLNNIKVDAIIDGNSITGLVAGYNSVTGKITNCSVTGSVVGKHYVGGIVGTNYGKIDGCTNKSEVNTVVDTDKLDIESLTLETIMNSENVAAITDVGGIAGTNFGVISNCTNYSTVGYDHVGYNVGGIAGSHSGYLETSYNYGIVKGRKEVGGIVGQQEPCLIIKYSEDYLQKMKRQINSLKDKLDSVNDDITSLGEDTLNASYTISNNLNEAYNSIEVMLNEGFELEKEDDHYVLKRTDDYETAKTALSASMTKFFDSWNWMINSNKGNVEDLSDDLSSTNELVNELGNTAVDAVDFYTSERDLYVDVSDKDDDKQTDGKLKNCINYNFVKGDLNVGGIAGSIAKENNLDPEDDFDITGKTSTNFTYQMRAVIDRCNNFGRVTVKKNYAGGIVGNQTLGLVKNSINYGILDCEDADYIGGIVGISVANIKNSYAKCFIWGNDYVGGIAGSGTKAEGNGSLAQIVVSNNNVGSIFGNYSKVETELVQDAGDIKNNWYVYDDQAAIDGISYANKAYPISYEDMLALKIDDSLKKVNVIFMHDFEVVNKYTLEYGETLKLNDLPENIDEEYKYGYWEGFSFDKLENIQKDLLFINELNDVRPSISSNEDLALVVVEGNFGYDDLIEAEEIEELPEGITEGHTITYKYGISDASSISKLRIYTFGYENFDVYTKVDGVYSRAHYEIDGSYIVLDFDENIEAISIVEVSDYSTLKTISACLAGLGVVYIVIKKVKKKKATNYLNFSKKYTSIIHK